MHVVTQRRKSRGKVVVLTMAAACVLSVFAAGFVGFDWASAGSNDTTTATFGLEHQSAEDKARAGVSPETVDDKSDAEVLAVEDIAEGASLSTASSRDVSAGVEEIAAEEEAARVAAEKEARRAEERAIARADETRAKYYAAFGSLPAGDVDFSVGREAFISEWTERIDNYLAGSPLAGHGSTFAEAAWDAGIDPRWSPAISNTESTQGRVCFKSHNAWGWDQTNWPDWDTAIRAHVAGLAQGYGFTISYSYAMRYCPPNYDNWYRDTLGQMQLI